MTPDYPNDDRAPLITATMTLAQHIYDDLPEDKHKTFALRLAGLLATVWPSSHDAELIDALRGEWARLQ